MTWAYAALAIVRIARMSHYMLTNRKAVMGIVIVLSSVIGVWKFWPFRSAWFAMTLAIGVVCIGWLDGLSTKLNGK
jgi:UDP-N-acetylmuramyl pentapeptide phosphotransferase/UDP-N-acetylglucosamine-1-phosphate transferase